MSGWTVQVTHPTYIPHGFEMRRKMLGQSVIGLGVHTSQLALVYTKGWERDDWVYPLIFFATPDVRGPALAATAGHPGTPIDLQRSDLAGVYHDGWWALDRPPTADDGPKLTWDTSYIHSITVMTPAFRFAIRAAKVWAPVSVTELTQMARSVG